MFLHSHLLNWEARVHPLRQLFWECTLRCNLHCRHCGSDCTASALTPDMPFEDFEKVLLRIREVYNPKDILVIFSGGEPLMRKDLVSCGRRTRELGFPWGLVSNGFLMTSGKVAELISAGMRTCTISLDGLEESHDWMRGVPGSFARADEAIRALTCVPSVGFDVVTCVTQKNFGQLEAIREYLISAGRKEGRIKTSYGCEGFLGPYEGKVRDHLFSCQAGLSIASVRIDGAISGCTSIRSSYSQGNIYQDDFVDVWENRFGLFRDHTPFKTGPCATCKWWKQCRGNGMHLRGQNGELLLCNLAKLTD